MTAYDAAYVDLAFREGLQLATLDAAMRKAAFKSGVVLFEQQSLRQAGSLLPYR